MLCQGTFSPAGSLLVLPGGRLEDCIRLRCVLVLEASGDAGQAEALGGLA